MTQADSISKSKFEGQRREVVRHPRTDEVSQHHEVVLLARQGRLSDCTDVVGHAGVGHVLHVDQGLLDVRRAGQDGDIGGA